MPISIVEADVSDGVTKKSKFRSNVDHLVLRCTLSISDDLANELAIVNYQFFLRDLYWGAVIFQFSQQFNPGDGGWWWISWEDLGVINTSLGWHSFQALADVEGLNVTAISPELFFKVVV